MAKLPELIADLTQLINDAKDHASQELAFILSNLTSEFVLAAEILNPEFWRYKTVSMAWCD